MSQEAIELSIEQEEYVIEKYLGDVQTPENLLERIVILNDVIVEHYIREES